MDDFLNVYKEFWIRFLDFEGYTSRRKYWQTFMIHMLIGLLLRMFSSNLMSMYVLVVSLPQMAISIRRLRCAGCNPWSFLWAVVPFVGSLFLLYLMLKPDLYGVDEDTRATPEVVEELSSEQLPNEQSTTSMRVLNEVKEIISQSDTVDASNATISSSEKTTVPDPVSFLERNSQVASLKTEEVRGSNLDNGEKTASALWAEQFERLHGRRPSPEEYVSAKRAGFELERQENDTQVVNVSTGHMNPDSSNRNSISFSNSKTITTPTSGQEPKKNGLIWLGLALIPLIGLIWWSISGNPFILKEIDMEDYVIATTVYWSDGVGTAEVEIESIPEFEGMSDEVRYFLENPRITITPNDNLKSGDRFEVELSLDEEQAKKLGLNFIGSFYEYYRVDGSDIDDQDTSSETTSSTSMSESMTQEVISKDKILSVSSSSYLSEKNIGYYHKPENLIDGDRTTAWVEGVAGQGEGETITLSLKDSITLTALKIANGYQENNTAFYKNSRPSKIRLSFSDGSSQEFVLEDKQEEQMLILSSPISTSSVTLTILSVYKGSEFEDTGISEVELMGNTSSATTSQVSEAAINDFIALYRTRINQALANRSGIPISDLFTSTNNSDYLDAKDYIENQSAADHVARYEAETLALTNLVDNGETVSFGLDYRTTTYYDDGRSPQASNGHRDYILRKNGNSFLIEDF